MERHIGPSPSSFEHVSCYLTNLLLACLLVVSVNAGAMYLTSHWFSCRIRCIISLIWFHPAVAPRSGRRSGVRRCWHHYDVN